MKSVILATLCVCLVMVGMASSASVYGKKAIKKVDWHSMLGEKQNALRDEDGVEAHNGGGEGSSGGDDGSSEYEYVEHSEDERKAVMDVGFSMVWKCQLYDGLVYRGNATADPDIDEACTHAYTFVHYYTDADPDTRIVMENILVPYMDLIHCFDVFLEDTILQSDPETAVIYDFEVDNDTLNSCKADYGSVESEEEKVEGAFDEAEKQPEPAQQIMSRIISLLKKELRKN